MPPEKRVRLVDELFRAVWVDSLHVSEAGVIREVATRAGLDGDELVASAQSPEASSRLRQQTDEALAHGVFGIPSLLVNEELFFGYDDFVYIEQYLDGRDPLDRATMARWQAQRIRPSAQRAESHPDDSQS